jgi:hypothetical protein
MGLFQCCAGIRNGTQIPIADYYYVFLHFCKATIAIEEASINLLIIPMLYLATH